MPLSFQSRRVGHITVVKCRGPIIEGAEADVLKQHLNELFPRHPDIILNLEDVQFIDSSGLGLLDRFLTRSRNMHGNLKLCAVPPRVAQVLQMTKLATIFESYPSEADAISAFYEHAKFSSAPHRFKTDIVCVDNSPDVLAFVRKLLEEGGYGVLTADNLPDGLILLQATEPRLVVVGAALRFARDTRAAERFNALADARSVVQLPADFSTQEAGEAGQQLLHQVRAVMGAGEGPAAAAP